MSAGHVSCFASFDADQKRLVLDDQKAFNAGVKRLKLAAGERVVIRVEREEDAYTTGQRRHYFGYIVTPLSDWNGDFKTDWHLLLKSSFMPEGKTSITQLNREEMDDYIRQCEVYAHTAHPEAFALMDNVRTA